MRFPLLWGLPLDGEPIELRTHAARQVEAAHARAARIAAALGTLDESEQRTREHHRELGRLGGRNRATARSHRR